MPPEKKVKVVLDTNTVVSALLGRDSKPAEVMALIASGKATNHLSDDILDEIREVLSRPKIVEKTSEHERHYMLYFITSISETVTPKRRLDVVKEDDADNRILECALEAKADYVVSGDRHLLRLREHEGTKIVDSDQFLKEFAEL